MRAGEVRGGEGKRTAKELKRISNCHCQGDDDDARQAEGADSETDRQPDKAMSNCLAHAVGFLLGDLKPLTPASLSTSSGTW